MRKVIITILISIIFVSIINFSANVVQAKSEYRRIINTNTPFYSDASGTNLLFYLPYTYYVKILDQSNDSYCHVEYCGADTIAALDGYVPSSMLFSDGLSVENPYPNISIKTIDTAVLYSSASLDKPLQYIFKDRQMTYYGSFIAPDNTVLFFVGYNGKLGYVKESDVFPFTIENHPNELTFITPEQTPENPTQTPENSTVNNANGDYFSLRVIIIVCLLLAGIIALFVAISKRPKKSTTATYYDENDFE